MGRRRARARFRDPGSMPDLPQADRAVPPTGKTVPPTTDPVAKHILFAPQLPKHKLSILLAAPGVKPGKPFEARGGASKHALAILDKVGPFAWQEVKWNAGVCMIGAVQQFRNQIQRRAIAP